MEEKLLLIQFGANYADEFDVAGFTIMKESEWEEHLEEAEKLFEEGPQERYFGTNECIDFKDFDDYESAFDVDDITAEEAAVIRKFFGEWSFGNFLMVEDY